MRRLVVAPRAQRDLDDILARSDELFGDAAAERYRRLIDHAVANLLADPERLGVRIESGLPAWARLYPLRLASRGAALADRVSRPRHLLIFRYTDRELRLIRVLHERMNVGSHLGG